jgi:predicted ATPase/DNA-binding winged helix-turn-helix (wHTH) protein
MRAQTTDTAHGNELPAFCLSGLIAATNHRAELLLGPSMNALPVRADESYTFGPFELLPGRQVLLKEGLPVRIGGRPFDLLTMLVRQGGEIVSKRQLMAQVWPHVIVDEGNLKVNVAALRRAIGDDPDQPLYIATVVGRGYRFIAPVSQTATRREPESPAQEGATGGNLPPRLGPIFGRSAAIAKIAEELEAVRLVSIVGPGGIGKTTVALAIARQLAPSFPDGAWLVDLAEVESGLAIEETIALTLGLNEPGDLVEALRNLNLLLVLDNCEHVIDAAATCADELLARTRHVKLLTTSREPLSIRAERVRRLSGLAIPPAHSRAAEALEYAAVQLFVDRASASSPLFRLDDANASVVSEICRRLDGLALGIERVALRADSLDVDWMLEHIDGRHHMLDGNPAGPDRHRTLAAAVAWSYRLLGEDEQRVMRRLSACAGAFTLDFACAVAASGDIPPASVVEIVAGLAAKSLLIVATRDGEVEYRLSNVARAFGLEQLAAHGELGHAQRQRAIAVHGTVGEAGSKDLPGLQTMARTAASLEDIREAVSWALSDAVGSDLAVRLVIAAAPLYLQHGLVEECRAAVSSALDHRFRVHCRPGDEQTLRAVLAAIPAQKLRTTGWLKE